MSYADPNYEQPLCSQIDMAYTEIQAAISAGSIKSQILLESRLEQLKFRLEQFRKCGYRYKMK